MRWTLLVAAAAVGGLGLWVLWSHPAASGPRVVLDASRPRPQGDYYVVAVPQEPRVLNPFVASDGVSRSAVLAYTHDGLLALDPMTGETVPALADRVDADDDGRSFVLHLRDGVRFSDGEPMTMEDVLLTWEVARAGYELPGLMWSELRRVQSLDVLDQRRLRMVLKERHFAGLALVGAAYKVLQKRHVVAAVRARAERAGEAPPDGPADAAFGRFLLEVELPGPGTGPYQLARDAGSGALLWNRGVDLLLVQNPHSWHRSAHPERWNLAGLKLLFVRDPAAQGALLRTQGIDWIEDRDARERLAGDPALAAHYDSYDYGYLTLGPVFVVWNHEHEALGDPRVRRALTMLFDRERLLELRPSRTRRATSWFAPDTPRAGDLEPLPFDVEAARALLREAGWGEPQRPLELTLLTVGLPEYEQIADVARPSFAAAGVRLRKRVVEFGLLSTRIKERAFDGFVYAWNPDVFNDPTEIFHSTEGEYNWMRYASPEMDRVLEAARAELDDDRRLRLYHEFNRIFLGDQPVTLLYHRRISALLHKRFKNVRVGALGLSPRDWWVEPGAHLHP